MTEVTPTHLASGKRRYLRIYRRADDLSFCTASACTCRCHSFLLLALGSLALCRCRVRGTPPSAELRAGRPAAEGLFLRAAK